MKWKVTFADGTTEDVEAANYTVDENWVAFWSHTTDSATGTRLASLRLRVSEVSRIELVR